MCFVLTVVMMIFSQLKSSPLRTVMNNFLIILELFIVCSNYNLPGVKVITVTRAQPAVPYNNIFTTKDGMPNMTIAFNKRSYVSR